MNKERVDDILRDIFNVVPVVHEPRKVPIDLAFVLDLIRHGGIGCHFLTY